LTDYDPSYTLPYWHCVVMVRLSGLQLRGRRFGSEPSRFHFQVFTSHSYMCLCRHADASWHHTGLHHHRNFF